MDLTRWFELEPLFHQAMALPRELRAEFLARWATEDAAARSTLHDMVREAERDEDAPLEGRGFDEAHAWLGRRIGTFEVQELLGRGGMGTVFRGIRNDPRQEAAIKVIRRSSAFDAAEWRTLMRRFRGEVGILERLSHSGIARFYESGLVDWGEGEQPFLAMELVRGTNLLEHAAGMRTMGTAAPLDARGRLELLAGVADAVQHAHQKGIVHRDLKPANVLVTDEGTAKVLDFGVARVLGLDGSDATRHTLSGQPVGTLAYMAPEQARGQLMDVDTRSDVYALGAMLFELLSGRPALDLRGRTLAQSLQVICETTPPRISSLRPEYRGEVDTIIAKALAAAPEHRYGSAGELAADIRRHLHDEPISARAQTTADHLRRIIRRHRATSGLAALALLLLLTASGVALMEGSRARLAERRWAERLEQITQHLLRELDTRSGTLDLRALVAADARQDAHGLLDRDPGNPRLLTLAADADRQYSNVLHEQGRLAEALKCREEAYRLRCRAAAILGETVEVRRALAIDMVLIADVHFAEGHPPEYRRWLEQSAAMTRAVAHEAPTPDNLGEHAWSLQRLSAVELHAGNLDAGIQRAEDALAICDTLLRDDPTSVSALGCARQCRTYLGVLHEWKREPEAASDEFTRALELADRLYQIDTRNRDYLSGLLHALESLADHLAPEQARPMYERGYELARAWIAADPHPVEAVMLARDFALRMAQGALKGADGDSGARLAREARVLTEGMRAVNVRDVWAIASGFGDVALLLERAGVDEEALSARRSACRSCLMLLEHADATPEALRGCAEIALASCPAEELTSVVQLAQRALDHSPEATFALLTTLGRAQLAVGDRTGALAAFERARPLAIDEDAQTALSRWISQAAEPDAVR